MSEELFEAMKQDDTLLFQSLPALSIDNTAPYIEDPMVITKHLAKIGDAAGNGRAGNKYLGLDHETPYVDAIAAKAQQMSTELLAAKGDDAATKAICQKWFPYFQKVLDINDDNDARSEEWTYGKQLTYADIILFEAVHFACTTGGVGMLLRTSFPKLKEFHGHVATMARVEIKLPMHA